MIKTRIVGVVLGIVLIASGAWAQDWRGNGRMRGVVVDEQNKPLEGVRVVGSLDVFIGVVQVTTDRRGNWSIDGLADGSWQLAFEKEGYDPAKGNAEVDEGMSGSTVRTKMTKAFDPNAFVQAEVKKAEALMNQKKYAEARGVYEAIVARVPEVSGPIQINIAQTYYGEGNLDAAIERLKAGVAAVPTSDDAKILLANMLSEKGALDEAGRTLASVDEAAITGPQIYLNFAVAYVKAKNPEGALPYLDKAVTRFPQSPLVYYYRATALIEILNTKKDPKDPARADLIAKIKPDLQKVLQLSPTGPEAAQAKRLLDELSK